MTKAFIDPLKEKLERATSTGVKNPITGEIIPFPSYSKVPSKYPVREPESYTPWEENKDFSVRSQIVQPKIDKLNTLAESIDTAKKDYESAARNITGGVTQVLAEVSREKYRKAVSEYNSFYNQNKDEIKTYITLAEREEERYKANLFSARDAATVNGEIDIVYNEAEEKHKALDNSEEIKKLRAQKEKYAIDESNARADVGNFDAVSEAEKYARLQSDIDKQIEEKHNAIDKEREERVEALKSEKEAYYEAFTYNDDFEEKSRESSKPDEYYEFLLGDLSKYLKKSEKDMVNYLENTQRTTQAVLYLKSIKDYLVRRKAAKQVEETEDLPVGFEQIAKTGQAAIAGVERWGQGIANETLGLIDTIGLIEHNGEISPTANQYAVEEHKRNSNAFGRFVYNLAESAGNMAPSILLSTLTGNVLGGVTSAATATKAAKLVGGLTMGYSAAGNAYSEGIKNNWSKGKAMTYGILVGTSEVLLERVLGGISALGGGSFNLGTKATAKILATEKAWRRVVGNLAVKGVGEGIEEGLQTVLEPIFASMLGEESTPAQLEEVLYSAALGFFSVGLLESVDATLADKRTPLDSKIINEYIRQGKKAKEGSLEYVLAKELQDTLVNNPKATWTAFEIGRIVKNYKQNGYTPSNTDAVISEKAVLDTITQNKNTPTENVESGKNRNENITQVLNNQNNHDIIETAEQLSGDDLTGVKGHSGIVYNEAQAKLLAELPVEALQNAFDLSSKQDITFNAVGISDNKTKQAWLDEGLAYIEKDADGNERAVINDTFLYDERERRAGRLNKYTFNTEVKANQKEIYISPEYETYETNKTVQPIDTQAVKKRRADATEQYGLTSDEATRLERYVGGQMCYILNKRMITGTLVDGDLSVINSIRNALLKMPEYSGRTYRNLQFKNEKEYNDFLSEYAEGNKVKLKAFTSTSKLPNGYTRFGNGVVHLVIDGVSGRDIADTFGVPRQQEVIYLPETEIEIKKVIVANDGNPLIFAQEVKANENIRTKETGNTGNDRPKTSVHQNIDGQGAESVRDGGNNSGLSEKAQNRDRRDGVLSQWRKSADSGNVRVDNGQADDGESPKTLSREMGASKPSSQEKNLPTVSRDGIEIKPESDPEIQKRLSEAKDDIERTGILSGASKWTISLARRLEKALGVKIRFELKPVGTRKSGRYERTTDTIYINMSEATEPVIQVIAHEFIHAIEGTKLHAALRRFVEKEMDRRDGKGSFNTEAHEKQKHYKEHGEILDIPKAMNEVVCEFVSTELLTSEEIITRFVSEQSESAKKFKKRIDTALSVFGEEIPKRAAKGRIILEKASKLYRDAMKTRKTGADLKTRVDELRQKYQNGEITEEEFDSSVDELDNEAKGIGLSIDDFFKGGGDSFSFSTSKSGMANDLLLPYDEEIVKFIKQKGDYIIDSYDKLVEVVNLAFDNPQLKATVYFGMIDADTLNKIKNNIPNLPAELQSSLFKENKTYSVAATLDSIRHIVDDKNLSRNDVIEYLDKLADTIVEHDTVAFDYYVDNNGQKNRGLLFKKRFEDGTLRSFEIVSNKKRSLNLQTLYLEKVDYKKRKSAETLLMDNPSAHTPKAGVGQTSTNSIPKTSQNVNSKNSHSISTPVFTPEKVAKEVVDKAENNIDIAERVKEAQRKSLRARAKANLTQAEERIVDSLVSGSLTLDEVSDEYNKAYIKAIYEATLEYEEVKAEAEEMGIDVSQFTKSNNANSFSISRIKGNSGKDYGVGVYLDSSLLTNLSESDRKGMMKEKVVTEFAGKTFVAYDKNGSRIDVKIANPNDKIKSKSGSKQKVLKELYRKNNSNIVKQEAVVLSDELIQSSKFDSSASPKYSHDWLDNYGKNDWEYWKVYLQEKNKTVWEATLNIANTANGEKVLYDIDPIKKVEEGIKSPSTTTDNSISQTSENVNSKDFHSAKLKEIEQAKSKLILARAKSSLTMAEEDIVDSLIDGSLTLDEVSEGVNKSDIKAIYEATLEYEEAKSQAEELGIDVSQFTKSNNANSFSISSNYAKEIDFWAKEGKPDGESFVLGSTGEVLQGLGAIESDIYMLGEKINEILSEHLEMTIDEIKKIPEILENPVLVLKSKNVGRNAKANTRLVIFGTVKAKDGRPILSVLDLRPVENNLVVDDMQKVTSTYTKDVNPTEFIRSSEILYAEKNITTHLLSAIGFKMPITCNQSGYIGSISYRGNSVNIQGEEFSKVFKEIYDNNTDSYSISTPVFTPEKVAKEVVDGAEKNVNVAERLPRKAHNRLRQIEQQLCKKIAGVYGIYYSRTSELQEAVRTLVNEYLTDGSIDEKNTLKGYFVNFIKEKFGKDDTFTYSDGSTVSLSTEVKYLFSDAVRSDLKHIRDNYNGIVKEFDTIITEEVKKDRSERARRFTARKVREARNDVIDFIGISEKNKKNIENKIYALIAKITEGTLNQSDIDTFFNELIDGETITNDTMKREYSTLYKYLKTTKLTLTEEQRKNLTGYESYKEYREDAGSLLLLGKDGISVTDMYAELHELAPNLFSNDVINEGDMAVKILEIAKRLKPYEEKLSDVASESEKKEMYRQTRSVINALVRDVNTAVKYVQGTATVSQEAYIEDSDIDIAEITDKLEAMKRERVKMLKARAKTILSANDEDALQAILKGRKTVSDFDDSYNKKDIEMVYEASKEYYKLKIEADEYRRAIRQRRYDRAAKYLADGDALSGFRDHSCAFLYMINPLERNLEYIGRRSTFSQTLIDAYVKPIKRATQAGILYRNSIVSKIKALDISRKVKDGNTHSEAFAVQFVGEAMSNIEYLSKRRDSRADRDGKNLDEWKAELEEFWKVNSAMSQTKILNAVEVFRNVYDDLFKRMNEARVKSGYEPISYRNGYFPHFNPKENNDFIALFGKSLGFNMEFNGLPATINGLTHSFKPGIKYFGAAESRQGYETIFDAIEGLQRYLDGAIDVIFQTDNIGNLRALAQQIRYQASDDGKKHREDRLRANNTLTEEERAAAIDRVHKEGSYTLGNFVTDLEEYTNILAGKKSRFDRGTESFFGRDIYSFVKNVNSKIAANMVSWNIGSWLTNFIPLVQGEVGLEKRYMLEGMWDALKNAHSPDGFEVLSTWLTNRRGGEDLLKSWEMNTYNNKVFKAVSTSLEAFVEMGGKPMEWIDMFVSNTLVRGRYKQNIAKGLDSVVAIEEADSWVSGLMADRSKGGMPTVFNATSPIFKAFTQFQLEVSNQYGFFFRDFPKDFRDKAILKWCIAIFKYLIAAYLFNDLYEKLTGRRPALDPVGIVNDTVGNSLGVKLNNAVDVVFTLAKGEGFDLTREVHKMNTWNALADFGGEIVEEVPYVGGLLGGGRIPMSSALPDIEAVGQTLFSDTSTEKKLQVAGNELAKTLKYAIYPGAGGQISKTVKGIKAVKEGGVYTVDSKGREKLQYPITPSIATYIQAGLFGPTATKGGQEWISSGFSTGLSWEETSAYKAMVDEGITQDEAFDILDALGNVERTDEDKEAGLSTKGKKAKALGECDTLNTVKRVVYEYLYMRDSDKEFAYLADEFEVGKDTLIDFLIENHDATSGKELVEAFGDILLKNDKVSKRNHSFTLKEKAVIYQIISNNETNPYNQTIGKRIWKIMNPDEKY